MAHNSHICRTLLHLIWGMGNFSDREGHKNVILATRGPDCNHALPPVGYCNPIIQLANLTQRQNIHIPEWYTIISLQWHLKNHHSIRITQAQSATIITTTIFMFDVHFYSQPSHLVTYLIFIAWYLCHILEGAMEDFEHRKIYFACI